MNTISIKNFAAAAAIVGALGVGATLAATPWTASAATTHPAGTTHPGGSATRSGSTGPTHGGLSKDTPGLKKGTTTTASATGSGSAALPHAV